MCQHSGRYEIDERGHPDEEWKTTSELKISRLEKTDLGEYTCSASSSMGKAEATLRVYGESTYTYTIDEHSSFFDDRHSIEKFPSLLTSATISSFALLSNHPLHE